MECPRCGHERTAPHLRCSQCGTTLPRRPLESYDHLRFLLAELSAWASERIIDETLRATLARRYRDELERVEVALGIRGAPPVAEQPTPAPAAPPPVAPPAVAPRPGPLYEREPVPREAGPLAAPPSLRPADQEPPPGVQDEVAGALARAMRPRLTWEDVWRALLSPRALEALLYAGALLILGAAATFVYFNWGIFPPLLQMFFLAAGTAVFYLAGWLLRTRWRLEQSGVVVTGIGALIIPVDFFAWARFREAPPEAYPGVWMLASVFCSAVYGATAWWLRRAFFTVLVAIALHSLLLAALAVLGVDDAWWGAPTVVLAMAWRLLQPWMAREAPALARPVALTGAAAAAIAVAATSVLPWRQWVELYEQGGAGGVWVYPVAAAWWAAAGFSVIGTNRLRSSPEAAAAAGILAVAITLTLLGILPLPWVSLGVLGLAVVYAAVERRLDPAPGKAFLDAGIVLSLVAHAWAAIAPVTTAAVFLPGAAVLGWWAFRFSMPPVLLGAQAVFLIGAVALVHVLGIAGPLWPVGVLASAGAALVGAWMAAAHPALARPLYAGGYAQAVLALWAAFLLPSPAAVQVICTGGLLAISVLTAVRTHRGDDALRGLSAALLPGVPVFQWLAAALAGAELAVVWAWRWPSLGWLPAAAVGLALAYIVLGRRLRLADPSYERPWRVAGVGLSVLALSGVTVADGRSEVVATLLLGAAAYLLWAAILDRPVFAHLGAWLALAPAAMLLPDAVAAGVLPSREAYAWGFAALGTAYLAAGVALDHRARRFAPAAHTPGHALVPFALVWALQDALVARWTLATAVAVYAALAWLVHRGRAFTFQRLVERLAPALGEGAGAVRAGYVYAVAWLLPFWLYLTASRTPGIGPDQPRLGVFLAAVAIGYLVAGRRLRRANPHYAPPLWIAAQALVIVGGLLAAAHRPLLMAAVGVGVALQALLYAATRQVAWVYTGALGGAGLFGLALAHLQVPAPQAGWALIGLAGIYLAAADRVLRRTGEEPVPPPAAAFFAVAFLVAVVGVLLAAFRTPAQGAVAYTLAALVFLWSGRRLGEPLFGYPVAGLLAAAYVAVLIVAFRRWEVPPVNYGIWLAPGIAGFLAAAHVVRPRAATPALALLGTSWAGALHVAAHAGTVTMMLYSTRAPGLFPLSLALGAAVYGLSAAMFRSPRWLYPALAAAHLAIFFGLLRTGLDPRLVPAAFVPVAAILLAVARRTERTSGRPTWGAPTWAQAWYLMLLADLVLWPLAGLIDARSHVAAALGFALVAGLMAEWWQDRRLALASLALVALGAGGVLRWLALHYAAALLGVSLVALALGLWVVAMAALRRAALWQAPGRLLALAISTGALVVSAAGVGLGLHADAGRGFVFACAVVGLTYLLFALERRLEWLGYVGVGLLEVAWILYLLEGIRVREPQWYAIPAALYLLGIGAVERRLGRRALAQAVDYAGLLLLFGSSFWQSLAPQGFPYAVLLAVEALAVTAGGALRRIRRYFFGGLGVLLLDAAVQAIDPVRALDKTVLFLALGLLLVVLAVLAERRREEIMRTAREWRARLEGWE